MTKPAKTTTSTWKAHYPYQIRKIVRWNYDRAKNDIHYELWEYRTNWRGNIKWHHVGQSWSDEYSFGYKGDLDWAKRTAKRFNLKVPK